MNSAEKRTSAKLCKVKRAGESYGMSFIDRTQYYNLSQWFV